MKSCDCKLRKFRSTITVSVGIEHFCISSSHLSSSKQPSTWQKNKDSASEKKTTTKKPGPHLTTHGQLRALKPNPTHPVCPNTLLAHLSRKHCDEQQKMPSHAI
jgi:hypothetical protein